MEDEGRWSRNEGHGSKRRGGIIRKIREEYYGSPSQRSPSQEGPQLHDDNHELALVFGESERSMEVHTVHCSHSCEFYYLFSIRIRRWIFDDLTYLPLFTGLKPKLLPTLPTQVQDSFSALTQVAVA